VRTTPLGVGSVGVVTDLVVTERPRLRGVSHLVAFFVSLVLGPVLVAAAATPTARLVCAIYAVCLAALFGCSALLHRGNWSPATRVWLRRLDHSTIFLFIAGTYTPVVALTLAHDTAVWILTAVWLGAAIGVAVTLWWIHAPRWVSTACYLAVGWIAVLALPALWTALGPARFGLLAAGAVLYTLGAVVYARKRPDPWPEVFGFHEVFHALVIAAVICHYALIWSVAT
jgi:hemolysin III